MNKYIVSLLIFFVVIFWASIDVYQVKTSRKQVFIADKSYNNVLKSLIFKKILEEMVTANGGELLDNKYDHLSFKIDKLQDPTWNLHAKNKFIVKYEGDIIVFSQEVDMHNNKTTTIHAVSTNHYSYKLIENKIKISPENGKTKIVLENSLIVERKISPIFYDYFSKQVNDSADKSVENFHSCFAKNLNCAIIEE